MINQRILELWHRSNHDEEVFAELIIEECAMVAYRSGFCHDCGGGEYISKDIRDHFRGVKNERNHSNSQR
jgi:hypothetical protein